MIRGIDCATPLTAQVAAELFAKGFRLAGRYLVPERYKWKRLTRIEAEDITSAGLKIISVFETSANRPKYGAVAGQVDGLEALKEAKLIKQPTGSAIYFAVDYDAPANDYDNIEAYLRAAGSSIEGYDPGVYGSHSVCEEMARRIPGIRVWQTYAWSRGMKSDKAHMYQYQNDVKVAGVTLDLNEVYDGVGYWNTKGEVESMSLYEKIRVSIDPVKQITLGDYDTKGSDVRVVKLDPAEWDADFIFDPKKTVEQIAKAHNADIAINGPYIAKGGTGILGYSRNKSGIISYDSEPKMYPWHGFAMKQGIPYIGPIAGADVVDFAFKAGPVVVSEGKNVAKERMDVENTQSDIRARKPRPVIFLDKSGIITIAVVDGWTQKYENKYDQGLNPIELGQLGVNLFGAQKGINGDGGGSTTLYIKGEGVVNALQDGTPRAVGHALIFRRKPAAPPQDWKQATVEWLHSQGMTDTIRDPNATPTWAELGAALMRMKGVAK